MRKKLLAILVSTTVIASALTGCSKGTDTTKTTDSTTQAPTATSAPASTETNESIVTEPTELSFIFADGDEGAKKAMNEIVNKFNEAYTDITVTIEPGIGGAYSDFIKTKDSVGEFPDIVEMQSGLTSSYVRAGKLEPLSDDIVSVFKTTVDFEGSVYTAPMAAENTMGIIYNKKYFDDNGLKEPATYDEFLQLCQTIKEKGDMSPLVVGGQDIFHLGFLFNKAYTDQVLATDPDFITKCYQGTKDWNDDAVKATLKELQTIFQYAQDGWVSTPDAQITTFLVNNMSAMMYSGTHMFKQIETADPNFEYGWFAVPSPDGKTRLVGGGGAGGLAISAESAKDPNKKAAAEAFIKFFFQDENYKILLETVSAMPTTAKTIDNLNVSAALQEVIDANNKADELSPMWNNMVGTKELPADFRNFTYKTTIEYLLGEKDIDAACQDINNTWKTALASFNPATGVGVQ